MPLLPQPLEESRLLPRVHAAERQPLLRSQRLHQLVVILRSFVVGLEVGFRPAAGGEDVGGQAAESEVE